MKPGKEGKITQALRIQEFRMSWKIKERVNLLTIRHWIGKGKEKWNLLFADHLFLGTAKVEQISFNI